MGINKASNYFLASMLDLIYKSGLPPTGCTAGGQGGEAQPGGGAHRLAVRKNEGRQPQAGRLGRIAERMTTYESQD